MAVARQRVLHLSPEPNPALVRHAQERSQSVQNPNRRSDHGVRRIDDLRLHRHAWFACWIGFGVEDYPYGLLTMIVSPEAIFLSTFVMIS
jgi:hypothetical protein